MADMEDEKLVGADRVLATLIEVAAHPEGVSLDDLATILRSSKPTIHRALVSLRRVGLADQTGRGQYVLGDEFVRLAFRYHEARPDTARIEPVLRALSAHFGETTHYAVLDGHDVVYRAKADPELGAVRLTSVVGGRNPATRTAVGKMLLSGLIETSDQLESWLGDQRLEPRTPNSIMSIGDLFSDLEATRRRGYAIDDQESEVGVNCVALPVYLNGPSTPTGAVSVSGLTFRCPLSDLEDSLPAFVEIMERHLGPDSTGALGY